MKPATISAFTPVQRVPLAQQIVSALQTRIAEGFKPGDPLPSMRALCRQFDVSINTIQTAIATLAREGLVEKRPGSGVYVTERAVRKRIGILSELDLLDPRIGPHFRTVAKSVREQLHGLGAEPALYVGHAEPGRKASDQPTCHAFWADAASGRLDGAIILDVPSTPAWHVRVKNCPIPAVGAMTPFPMSPDMTGIVDAGVRALGARGCRRLV